MAASPTTPRDPMSPPRAYDRERLLARLGGNTQILAEVAGLFCAETERMLRDIEEHVKGHDPRARGTAHQLKGVLLNVAADSAALTARELETLIRAERWTEGQALVQQLGSELSDLIAAFSREASPR